jgi:rhamnose utilization protein RhaD (predicted bifunctional aldolase and dehydrogenase)
MSVDINAIEQGLIDLSHALGREERGLAILGEGNASADCRDGTFLVKASGSSLARMAAADLSRVRFSPVLALLARDAVDHDEVQRQLVASLADPAHKRPSVETFFHAACLTAGGARWVAHAHGVAVNGILCSTLGARPFRDHVLPDAIVVCGQAPAVVPYVDPGFALAKAVLAELRRYRDAHGQGPKLLLMENHGAVALGQSAREALGIMLMAEKWAKVLLGTYAVGGPRFLSAADVERIDSRSDERYRRKALSADEPRPAPAPGAPAADGSNAAGGTASDDA